MDQLYESLCELEDLKVELLDNYHYYTESMIYDIANEYTTNQAVLTEASIINILKSAIDKVIAFIKQAYDKFLKVFKKALEKSKQKISAYKKTTHASRAEKQNIKLKYIGPNFLKLIEKFDELKGMFNNSLSACKDYTSSIDTIISQLILKNESSDIKDRAERAESAARRHIQSAISSSFDIDIKDIGSNIFFSFNKINRNQIDKFLLGTEKQTIYIKYGYIETYQEKFEKLQDDVDIFFNRTLKSDIDKEISQLQKISDNVKKYGTRQYHSNILDDNGNPIEHEDDTKSVNVVVGMINNVQKMMREVIIFGSNVASRMISGANASHILLCDMSLYPERFTETA